MILIVLFIYNSSDEGDKKPPPPAPSTAEKANSDSQPESSFAGFDNFGDQDGFTDNPMLAQNFFGFFQR